MDAYGAQAFERAKAETAVEVGLVKALVYQQADVVRFREYLRSYTVDAVLRARALFF